MKRLEIALGFRRRPALARAGGRLLKAAFERFGERFHWKVPLRRACPTIKPLDERESEHLLTLCETSRARCAETVAPVSGAHTSHTTVECTARREHNGKSLWLRRLVRLGRRHLDWYRACAFRQHEPARQEVLHRRRSWQSHS